MCLSKPKIQAPPEPEPIPETPMETNATTKKVAPKVADSSSRMIKSKKQGRQSLRIPLTAGMTTSGLNFPTP